MRPIPPLDGLSEQLRLVAISILGFVTLIPVIICKFTKGVCMTAQASIACKIVKSFEVIAGFLECVVVAKSC